MPINEIDLDGGVYRVLKFAKGCGYTFTLTALDDDEAPIDLSAYSFELRIDRKSRKADTKHLQKTSFAVSGANSNVVTVIITESESNIEPQSGLVWQFYADDGTVDTGRKRWTYGPVLIKDGVEND